MDLPKIIKFRDLEVGTVFQMANDEFYHSYRKIKKETMPGFAKKVHNAINLETGQRCWFFDSVSVVVLTAVQLPLWGQMWREVSDAQ